MITKHSWTVVIPAYNEEATVEEVLKRTVAALTEVAPRFDIVLVDDGSTDGTGERVRRFTGANGRVKLITHPRNRGIGEAVLTGYGAAQGELIVFMPADLQFDPNDLRLFAPYVDEADVVVCYRPTRHDSLFRKALSRVDHVLVRLLFGLKVRDLNWVKVYKRWVIKDAHIRSRSPFIEKELLLRAKKLGAKITEVPAPHYPRAAGKSKGASLGHILGSSWDLVRLWWELR